MVPEDVRPQATGERVVTRATADDVGLPLPPLMMSLWAPPLMDWEGAGVGRQEEGHLEPALSPSVVERILEAVTVGCRGV